MIQSPGMYIPDKTMWTGIGHDFMTHELILTVLQQGQGYEHNGQDNTNIHVNGWLIAEMTCQCYLTQSKRFSVGQDAITQWLRMNYQSTHYTKKNLLSAMDMLDSKPENFVKFEYWYYDMLPKNKCFYNNSGKPFSLRFTEAMIRNIHKKVENILPNENPEPLWIDVYWTLTEVKNEYGVENAILPSEVWTS